MGLSKKGWVLLTTVILISLMFAFYFLVYVKENERKIVTDNFRVLTQMKSNIENLLDSEWRIGLNEKDKPYRELEPTNLKWLPDSVSGLIDKYTIFTKGYNELFRNELIERRDIFEFIAISKIESIGLRTLYTNYPLELINYPQDSNILENFTSQNFFEIDFGYNQYLVFNTHLGSYGTTDIFFAGYINIAHFNEKKREVSAFFITLVIILTILMILAFPILKLRIMSNEERLNRKDVLFAGVSLTFGPVILILFFLLFMTNMFVEKKQETQNLEKLSILLIDNFSSELNKALFQLKHVKGADLHAYININNSSLKKNPSFDPEVWYMDYFTDLGIRYFNFIHWKPLFDSLRIINFDQFVLTNSRKKHNITNSDIQNSNLIHWKPLFDSSIKRNLDKLLLINAWNKHYFTNIGTQNYNLIQWKPFNNKNFDQLVLNNAWNKHYFTNTGIRYFNSIFWTDSRGKIKIYLSSENDPKLIKSLNHRRYVMDIVNKQYLDYKGDAIALESIRSVSDGNYEIGLGLVSGNKEFPVLATSFSLTSLMNPILEEGYGFCLFDSQGKTLFHSDIQRNLNENFLEETGEIFNAYLLSGISHHTAVTYMDKKHYMYLNKIPDVDGYFLATFVEKSYKNSPNAIAINMTVEMQLAFFILLFLFYLILYATAVKRNKLKQRIFLFNWLTPFSTLEKPNKYLYLKLFGVNVLVLAYMLLSWLIFKPSPDLLILNIFSAGMLLTVLNFWKLSKAIPGNERMYTKFYDKEKLSSTGYILGAMALLLIFGKIWLYKNAPNFVDDVILTVLTGYGIFQVLEMNLDKKNKPKIKSYFTDKNFLNYKLYVFSLIVLFSVIPTLVFFSINYNKEKEIVFKHNMVALKQKKDYWKEGKKAQFFKKDMIKKGIQESTIYALDSFVDIMEADSLNHAVPASIQFANNSINNPEYSQDQTIKSDIKSPNDSIIKFYTSINQAIKSTLKFANDGINKPVSSVYDYLYAKARVEFDSYGINSRGFIKNGNPNDWVYNNGGIDFYNTPKSERITGHVNTIAKYWYLIFLFLIFMLFTIYGLLNYIVHKLFGLDFKEYADKLVLTQTYKEIGEKLRSIYDKAGDKKDSYNNSFIVGVNISHVSEIKEILQEWKKEKFYTMDLLDLPNVIENRTNNPNLNQNEYFTNLELNFQILIKSLIKSTNNNHNYLMQALKNTSIFPNSTLMVFIEHFEFSYDNMQLNRVKMNILQRLVSNPSIRVVVSSEISPIKLYEYYEDSIKKMEAITLKIHENKLENRKRIEEVKADYKNWLQLLGSFFRITIPIERKKTNAGKSENEELEHGQYLDRIRSKFDELKIPMYPSDNYILNIQETSYYYYFSIWNSLSKEERYIVYDIAHDNLVNINNVDGIIDLLQKGILIYDHSLRLMNESFTNFVLAKVDSNEALESELESTKGGRWDTTSAVFLLIIISLIIFISFGKINMLEDVNALLGSLAAVFTLLLRMGGIFVLGKKPD